MADYTEFNKSRSHWAKELMMVSARFQVNKAEKNDFEIYNKIKEMLPEIREKLRIACSKS